jgi:hypothetical protein
MDNHWEWKNGVEIHTGINITKEGLKRPFTVFRKPQANRREIIVPAGTYNHAELQLVTNSNQAAPLSFRGTYNLGGYYGGDRVAASSSLKFRAGESFNVEGTWNYNQYYLPVGDFTTNILRARVSYSFTPRLFVQGLLQYNDLIEIWSTNLRLGWLHSANTGLFVVYNEALDTFDGLDQRDRSLIVKFSRLFDLLD